MTTFSTDADIIARDPYATGILPASDAGSWERLRNQVYDDICLRLRSRGVDPATVDDSTGVLKKAEVLGVLAEHYHQCATREEQDFYRSEGRRLAKAYEALLASAAVATTDDELDDIEELVVERG